MAEGKITVRGLSRSYGELRVLENINMDLEAGHTYCLMGPSGSGKTTFLRLLLGLEQPDAGTVQVDLSPDPACRLRAVFQEDRLCESFSALENICMAVGKEMDRQQVYAELCRLLPEESVTRPVCTLSGGMKRRAAILRALLAPSCGILMDEPFTGLDEDTRRAVITCIREKTAGKLLVVATHQEEDIAALGGTLITLTPPTAAQTDPHTDRPAGCSWGAPCHGRPGSH